MATLYGGARMSGDMLETKECSWMDIFDMYVKTDNDYTVHLEGDDRYVCSTDNYETSVVERIECAKRESSFAIIRLPQKINNSGTKLFWTLHNSGHLLTETDGAGNVAAALLHALSLTMFRMANLQTEESITDFLSAVDTVNHAVKYINSGSSVFGENWKKVGCTIKTTCMSPSPKDSLSPTVYLSLYDRTQRCRMFSNFVLSLTRNYNDSENMLTSTESIKRVKPLILPFILPDELTLSTVSLAVKQMNSVSFDSDIHMLTEVVKLIASTDNESATEVADSILLLCKKGKIRTGVTINTIQDVISKPVTLFGTEYEPIKIVDSRWIVGKNCNVLSVGKIVQFQPNIPDCWCTIGTKLDTSGTFFIYATYLAGTGTTPVVRILPVSGDTPLHVQQTVVGYDSNGCCGVVPDNLKRIKGAYKLDLTLCTEKKRVGTVRYDNGTVYVHFNGWETEAVFSVQSEDILTFATKCVVIDIEHE